MTNLHSYVPENLQFLHKQQAASRRFFEECALFSPEKNFQILASRGNRLPEGESFLACCGISLSPSAFLGQISPQSIHLLIPCKEGSVLLFADLFAHTGLLFGVLVPVDGETILRVLTLIGRSDFRSVAAFPHATPSFRTGDELLCRQLEELFYYTTRIFSPKPEASLWTGCLLIANFAGCRLAKVSLPIESPALSKRDEACMTLFLLASFLTLRRKSGEVMAEGATKSSTASSATYQCAVSFSEPETDTDTEPEPENPSETDLPPPPPPLPLFLSEPCFADLTATLREDGMKMETRFPILQKQQTLCASGSRRQILLEFYVLGALAS